MRLETLSIAFIRWKTTYIFILHIRASIKCSSSWRIQQCGQSGPIHQRQPGWPIPRSTEHWPLNRITTGQQQSHGPQTAAHRHRHWCCHDADRWSIFSGCDSYVWPPIVTIRHGVIANQNSSITDRPEVVSAHVESVFICTGSDRFGRPYTHTADRNMHVDESAAWRAKTARAVRRLMR